MVSKQRARFGQAAILSALAIAFSLAMAFLFGPMGFIASAVMMPPALMVLWLSADVLRFDERLEPIAETQSVAKASRAPSMELARSRIS